MLLLYRHNNAAYMGTEILQTSKWLTHVHWRRHAVHPSSALSEQLTCTSHSHLHVRIHVRKNKFAISIGIVGIVSIVLRIVSRSIVGIVLTHCICLLACCTSVRLFSHLPVCPPACLLC